MLKIENLCVKYDSIRVVHNVSLDINDGEIVAMIGANGAGKSTILKTISGLLKAESGKITMDSEDITRVDSHVIVQRGIIQVPEGRQIFTKMTIEENLKLGAFLQKDKEKVERNFERVLTLFPILKERLKQTAGTLSGGEQQMLAIGRALMGAPRLLLLDEPSMGLSPLMTQNVFDVLRQLKKDGITMLLVEQNAYDALEISDRTYILETGVVKITGWSRELIEDPGIKKAYLGGEYDA
ncbi:ABC transporter ATP-binding protein [Gudongella oleilytica]|jgi:branched-chain amino acid transport system ATP-binding protein|uniref:ABC transporter ATP-binding protein n=1 Tax=Gudongella oleilytica TaxID=1582259 RepID=UPI002A367B67|nr:ABC transporter ATP-binding protein [Gudongella oleilytica]MDY0257279.1 ABC transporter ATP-binding protein [Gudongella oleilytica]